MAKRKYKKPDLSAYNEYKRLSSDIELIIIQCIIDNNGDTAKTSREINLNIDVINGVYTKYYEHVKYLLENKSNTVINDSINVVNNMLNTHINELKKTNTGNLMSPQKIDQVLKMSDRLIKLKDLDHKVSLETLDATIKMIHRQKQLEKIEQGEIVDMSESDNNQMTVFNAIMGSLDTRTKPVLIFDYIERKYTKVNSVDNAATFIGCHVKTIHDSLRDGKNIYDRYKCKHWDSLTEDDFNRLIDDNDKNGDWL